ncbi:unnamed protein product [Ceutorhynchus assimilis]|uniref:Lymphocyte expansion molecule n=1 Tax=Ceutorhynchus assimilis TaxID=467358 RepID=A0A9N9MTK7_9CUCU|nr:unnamed protein product [Ceutorhynchus assimilis]
MKSHPDKPFKTYAPFGIATKRFTDVGFHPNLDKSGALKREITKLGPASFHPKMVQCTAKKAGGVSWAEKVEIEEFSKFLGFRNAKILNERQFAKTMRGPGSTEVDENLYRRKSHLAKDNVGFGSGPRISKYIHGQEAPPPQTYFRKVTESFEPSKKTFSETPTFEWDGFFDRFTPSIRSYHLPSNLYNPIDNKCTADITKKVVSTRGPYDGFTGPRNNTTIKNHFSPPAFRVPDTFYVQPSSLQHLLKHPSKGTSGVFLKNRRFPRKPTVRHMLNDLSLCFRNPNDPGPAHYSLKQQTIKTCPPSKYPFNSSNVNARRPVDWRVSPGPGRYNPTPAQCIKKMKDGAIRKSWVFLSTAKREFIKVEKYGFRE